MRPNILFLLPDQHRPDWLGNNPDLPLTTPNLDKLCSKGIMFNNAYTPSPVCAPARACLASGYDYKNCGVVDNKQNTPISIPTYYRNLRNSGYEVIGVGKLDLHKADRNWGLDGSNMLYEYGFTGGIDNEGKGDAILAFTKNGNCPQGPYMKYLADNDLVDKHLAMYEQYIGKPGWLNFPAITELPDEAYCDNWITDNAIKYLKDMPINNPWHIVINFVGPHGPFDVTSAMRSRWERVEFPLPVDNHEPNTDVINTRQQNYAAMIENIDYNIGRVLELVKDRGELNNTIIVYSSDHGEMLGDHNRWGKSVWYNPSTGVPLIIAGPNIRQNIRSNALVSLNDLSSTFLDYANAEPLENVSALSIRSVLEENNDQHRNYVTSSFNDWKMIFDGRYKLITRKNSLPILYDLKNDNFEMTNIASNNNKIVKYLDNILSN
jgi:arylsulfatase